MLPSTERLKRPSLFTRAYGARKIVSTPIFTLYVLPRQEKAIRTNSLPKRVLPMMGFVVSKKTSKSACRRNTMKRRVREAYRSLRIGGDVGDSTGAPAKGEENAGRLHRPLQDAARQGQDAVRQEQLSAVRRSLGKWYAMVLVIKEGALKTPWLDICGTMEKAFLEAARRYG